MNEGARNRLEARLKRMLAEAKPKKVKPETQSGSGNIIRRRAGEKDKRFSTRIKPGVPATAAGQ